MRHARRIIGDSSPHPLDNLRHRMVENGGAPLPVGLRATWGARLGRDLSSIRVHDDAESARDTLASGANALSYGPHLFFAPGRFDTGSTAGLRLLGHEVAHALQTTGGAEAVNPGADVPVGRGEDALEADARGVGARLSEAGPVRIGHGDQPPALRGDKKIQFSGKNITVSDTYVLYGPGVSPAFLTRFKSALDRYYNSRTFTYRGYTVNFSLSVREARYTMVTRGKTFPMKEMVDSSFDSDTELFNVKTGSGRAGGLVDLTLYDSSSEGTIAHEVGHYLSDRFGYFSERYSENLLSRIGSMLGISETTTTPDPGCEGDIMATSAGAVTECSLSDFLDSAIDEHEDPDALLPYIGMGA